MNSPYDNLPLTGIFLPHSGPILEPMKRPAPLLISLLLAPSAALAYCPAPPWKACQASALSDKVFVGRVTAIEPLRKDRSLARDGEEVYHHRFTIAVEEAFKGRVGKIERVVTGNDSGRWIADQGERRVVFAYHGRVGGLCSDIDEAAHVDATIKELRDIGHWRTAIVEGRVGGLEGPPVAGHEIGVVGGAFRQQVTTDADGFFEVHVPPGRYRVVTKGALPLTPYSRDDVGGFRLRAGECAQFQLTTKDPRLWR
jgi:hypothetical protein